MTPRSALHSRCNGSIRLRFRVASDRSLRNARGLGKVPQLRPPLSPRHEPAKDICQERMQLDVVQAVLKAADEWVSAQEALVAARQVSEKTDAEHEAVDIAGSRLVVAVMRWRSSRLIGSH